MLPLVFGGCISADDVVNSLTRFGVPAGWSGSFDNLAGIGTTFHNAHSGASAVYLSGQASSPTNATLAQFISPADFRGKRVRLSAWVKPVQLSGNAAGIWMRVDGEFRPLAFDNMQSRPVSGDGTWRPVSIVLDVADEAVGIAFGALLSGVGTMEVDDFLLEVVGNDVPTTNLITSPVSPDTVSRSGNYATSRDAPLNMGFEGTAQISSSTVSWIGQNAVSLASTSPTAPLTDLAPFGTMVGTAHVVALGEGTHGTREFQTQKHRFMRYLVENKGFTQFAIEGSAQDAELINQYVLTGAGDPAKLLAGLRFWTWNTQELLDIIKWMRQWNSSVAAAQRVQFHGFDFQQAAGQLDSVEKYIARVDTANIAFVRARYLCFDPYKTYGTQIGASIESYAARLATSRAACALGAKEVHTLIANSAATYKTRGTVDDYEIALHNARLVLQWEAFATRFNSTNLSAATLSRDSSMAENVQWLRTRAGTDAKFMLWAHNDHVIRSGGSMGRHLARAYGADYTALAFAFGEGVLNAVYSGSVQAVRPDPVPSYWVEAFLRAAKPSDFLLDLHAIAAGGSAAAALAGPMTMRTIGSTYLSTLPSGGFRTYYLPLDFDMLVYINSTHETTLLPFIF